MSTINPNISSTQGMRGSYETYVESWNPTTLAAIETLAHQKEPPSLEGVVIDIAFASFGKNPPALELHLPNFTPDQLQQLIDKVHGYGGEVKISFGGVSRTDPAGYNMWLSDFLKNKNDVSNLAIAISSFIQQNGFDGVDFDIEDHGVAADFPDLAAALIKDVRQRLPNAEITLTVPGQPWGQYWVPLIQKALPDISHINFMEYDIWIDKTGQGTDGIPKTYATQIQWDINYYISNLGIPPNKIVMGLIPGTDDIGNNITLQDATNLAKWAQGMGLSGVMTWDLNRDYQGQNGESADAYSNAIIQALSTTTDRYNIQQPIKRKKSPKTYRAERAPEEKLKTDKLIEPKPAGLFDLTAPPKRTTPKRSDPQT